MSLKRNGDPLHAQVPRIQAGLLRTLSPEPPNPGTSSNPQAKTGQEAETSEAMLRMLYSGKMCLG